MPSHTNTHISGNGLCSIPVRSFALAVRSPKEGLSDALRRELRPLGVTVPVIQPGAVDTPIWRKLRASADEIMASTPADVAEVYRSRFTAFLNANESRAYASKSTPTDYANAIAAALIAKRPKVRYRVGADSWTSAVARRVVPDRLMDTLIAATINGPHVRMA